MPEYTKEQINKVKIALRGTKRYQRREEGGLVDKAERDHNYQKTRVMFRVPLF